ncbi:MAG TPA: class I SAM-dependent methyltransferase [Rhodanobacteraceae bacterium]|nr:class I SAM-dependent methyltransferase [Rhodanobacteraceae bacterium]
MHARPRTSETNSRLWGARARDWADAQEAQHRPAYEVIMDRFVKEGTAVLDMGCGSGLAAWIAARKGAAICGIDATEPLLEIARERVPDGDFRVGDLEQLPFADAQFDLVTGFNSFQYAGNPLQALSEARRVARPGAHIVIMTWGPPDTMPAASLVKALGPLLPPPPPGTPGPFALSDEVALRALASQASLEPLDIVDVDSPFEYRDLETALRGLGSSGVAVRAGEHSGNDAVDDAHRAALAPFRQKDGSYRIGAVFRCLITGV